MLKIFPIFENSCSPIKNIWYAFRLTVNKMHDDVACKALFQMLPDAAINKMQY